MAAEFLLLVNGTDNLLLTSGDDLLLASSTVGPTGPPFLDDWDRADGAGLAGTDLTWTVTQGTFQILSNVVRPLTIGTIIHARAEHDVGSNDMTTEVVATHDGTAGAYVGVMARANGSDEAFYSLEQGDDSIGLYRYDSSGAFIATIDTNAFTDPVAPFTLRLTVSGTALSGYIDDVLVVSGTDGNITTGQRGGIVGTAVSAASEISWNNFETDAFVASTITPSPVVIPVEFPAATISATASITAGVVTIAVELPTPSITADEPDDATITAGTVTIQVELPQATCGGDATAGPQPLWRIGGYPLPPRVSRSTGERMLANR
jgi:hypothetical protein